MSAREPVLERRLRRLVVVAAAIAVVLAIVGFLPGERVYSDSNNCLGRAFAFTTEHHHETCESRYDKLVATRPAGGIALVLALALALVPTLPVYRKPTRKRGWMWFATAPFVLGAALVVLIAVDFHLDIFDHVEVLPAEDVIGLGATLFAAIVLVVLPIMLVVTRRPPPVPEARVVS